MISNQLLWIVLSTPTLDPSRSTLPLFKIFKFQPLQVWTRFAKFGEIHISSSPKILPKFRQPPGAMRGHPTKDQLKENFPHARIILSSTWSALLLCTFRKFRDSVIFLPSSDSVTRPQCALARCSQPLPPGQHPARTLGRFLASVAASLAGVGSFCGGCTFRGGQRGPEPARHATRRRPTPPGSPRVPAMPTHARGTVAVARQARNVLPAADGPRHPRSIELTHSTKPQPV